MITVGIDCGAKNTKAIVLKDGVIVGKGLCLTGFDQERAVDNALNQALEDAGISKGDVAKIAAVGFEYRPVNADIVVNEFNAMAKAGHFFFRNAGTVVDVGAEGSRVVKVGAKGEVLDFIMNEKCAAGAGTFVESMSRALEIPLEEIGDLALKSDNPIPMNAQCVIFAESEVVGLIHANVPKEDISRAIHDAMADRIVSMIFRLGMNEDVVLIGGMGLNAGFVEGVRRGLGLDKLYIPPDPEFGLAVGAAIVATASCGAER
ncbi:MAG: CoA activase [Desulfobacteraceae bacterium 4484_190.1]|nr:MAG: CoA activase [Desulfobacteraceae bacterium 4484_190.1]